MIAALIGAALMLSGVLIGLAVAYTQLPAGAAVCLGIIAAATVITGGMLAAFAVDVAVDRRTRKRRELGDDIHRDGTTDTFDDAELNRIVAKWEKDNRRG